MDHARESLPPQIRLAPKNFLGFAGDRAGGHQRMPDTPEGSLRQRQVRPAVLTAVPASWSGRFRRTDGRDGHVGPASTFRWPEDRGSDEVATKVPHGQVAPLTHRPLEPPHIAPSRLFSCFSISNMLAFRQEERDGDESAGADARFPERSPRVRTAVHR
ncbi:MAG: hypothetical protein OZSIB_1659 [Candidatus Ozemobacter sibiricus]|uniref:Uncharacterized protein n=1 Tax=Candidatus Ozemobacter sibiricus TaxID=2268124 RepID=A0A367ZLJ5_9BACT|nr:MAG: hypothetical protein OZSIB_1659 [Candidatus Ozemobacter sibiricus]